MEDKEAGR